MLLSNQEKANLTLYVNKKEIVLIIKTNMKREIEILIEESNQEFQRKNYKQSIKLLEMAWDEIPEPKGLYGESYDIVKDIIETYFTISSFDQAEKWLEKLFVSGLDRIDAGEREFYCGRVSFELENYEVAKEYFRIAEKKSAGRCFEDEDTKYLKFYKQ